MVHLLTGVGARRCARAAALVSQGVSLDDPLKVGCRNYNVRDPHLVLGQY
jgi:hypothetical protein